MNEFAMILGSLLRQFEAEPGTLNVIFDTYVRPILELFITWPLAGIAQAVILAFMGAGVYWWYRSWRLNADLLPNRLGDYHISMVHIGIRGKLRLWPLDPEVEPDMVRTIRTIPIEHKTYDELSADLKKELEEPPNPEEQVSSAMVPVRSRLEQELDAERTEVTLAMGDNNQMLAEPMEKHTLEDVFRLHKNPLYLYLAKALPTDTNSFGNDLIVVCTNHPIDHSDFYKQHMTSANYLSGYKSDVREISQSGTEGFFMHRTNKLFRGKKVKFMYYPVTPVKKGCTIEPQKFEMLNVFMSMMTQLEVFVDVLRQSKFNERYARELFSSLKRGQKFMLTLSRRNTDMGLALSTESYDEMVARRSKPELNPWIASGVMAGLTIMTFEVTKRSYPPNLTPETWLMSGILVGFLGVLIGWLWKRHQN